MNKMKRFLQIAIVLLAIQIDLLAATRTIVPSRVPESFSKTPASALQGKKGAQKGAAVSAMANQQSALQSQAAQSAAIAQQAGPAPKMPVDTGNAPSKSDLLRAIDGMIKAGYGRSDIFANAPANIKVGAENQLASFVNQNDSSLMQVSNNLGDLQSELTGEIYTVSQNIGKSAAIQYMPDYLQDIQTTMGKLQNLSIGGSGDASDALDYYRQQLISVAQRAASQLSSKIKGNSTTTSGQLPWSAPSKPLPTTPAKKGAQPPQKPLPQSPSQKPAAVKTERVPVLGGAAHVAETTGKIAQKPTAKPTLGQRIKGFFVRKKA